jgi:hypothetical protein
MDWRYGSSSTVPALQVERPGVKLQSHQKKRKEGKEGGREGRKGRREGRKEDISQCVWYRVGTKFCLNLIY